MKTAEQRITQLNAICVMTDIFEYGLPLNHPGPYARMKNAIIEILETSEEVSIVKPEEVTVGCHSCAHIPLTHRIPPCLGCGDEYKNWVEDV